MAPTLRHLVRPLTAAATYRRWAFLVLGGALLVPYVMLANALGVLLESLNVVPVVTWTLVGVGTLAALVATASVPTVRAVMATGARDLLRGPLRDVHPGPASSWPARVRTAAWLLAHILVGGLVSVLSLAVPIAAIVAMVAPLAGSDALRTVLGMQLPGVWRTAWGPVGGVVAVLALLYLVAAAGWLLTVLGRVLLGPSAQERMVAAERRAADLAQRNRLARELHDSVGHALSVVAMQATAAGRVLDDDPAFAGQALDAIATQARLALDDLDHVLGLLREDSGTTPQPTLDDLARLLADLRGTGMTLDATVGDRLDRLPRVVSREAYRIVQECLTNALRHAPSAPVSLRVTATGDHLEIDVRNPLPDQTRANGAAGGGGRGITGIGERVALLGGHMTSGATDGQWRVHVRVPVGAATAAGGTGAGMVDA